MAEKKIHSEYNFQDGFDVNENVLSDWNEYGYIIVRILFDEDEMRIIHDALESDEGIRSHSYNVADGSGKSARMCLWNQPGSDVTGIVARVHKMATTMEKLLGDEVYHYHTKLMMKNSGTAGFNWHQDYGYWYHNGCLFPDMGTAFIAVDKTTRENGCLQIIERSHLVGRIEHGAVGGQMGADVERVEELQKVLPSRYVELAPGDVLFFHSNILHTSSPNTSDMRRWALLVAYNTRHNNPTREHDHPLYTKLEKVDNKSVHTCPTGSATCLDGKDFLVPGEKRYGKHVVTERK